MSYARVVMYELRSGTVAVTLRGARDKLLPLFREQPGFLSYQVLRMGVSAILSISCWASKDAAEQGHRVAAEWVKGQPDTVVSSKMHIAEVAFDSDEELAAAADAAAEAAAAEAEAAAAETTQPSSPPQMHS